MSFSVINVNDAVPGDNSSSDVMDIVASDDMALVSSDDNSDTDDNDTKEEAKV